MTVQEVSEYLKIPVSTLYVLSKKRLIPAAKVGKHWRYLESDILGLWNGRVSA
ncbi:MAG: helix-turn-helix domain-containing protein [Candidatus Omnitrophica bacterium]|nr:helix-turn-helix domain-containing protein [Candidatus Omnitrophota bacterium]